MKQKLLAAAVSLLIISCEVKVKSPGEKSPASTTTATSSKIRNGIDLTSKDLKVEQAFLTYEDGKLVTEENKIEVGQKVIMHLIIEGWKEKDGKVFLDASEKVETNTGKIFLDEKSLFKNYTDGVAPSDASTVTLSVVITGLDRLYDYFLVSFNVEDKAGGGTITGSYKLYLK